MEQTLRPSSGRNGRFATHLEEESFDVEIPAH